MGLGAIAAVTAASSLASKLSQKKSKVPGAPSGQPVELHPLVQKIISQQLAGTPSDITRSREASARDTTAVEAATLMRTLETAKSRGLSTGSTEDALERFYSQNTADVIVRKNEAAKQDYDNAFRAALTATKQTAPGLAPAPAPGTSGKGFTDLLSVIGYMMGQKKKPVGDFNARNVGLTPQPGQLLSSSSPFGVASTIPGFDLPVGG